jgi:hypothetical protein
MKRAALVLIALSACMGAAHASDQAPPHDPFRAGADALSAGKYDEAIAELEAYADGEPPHPDASYDRGAAYVLRVKSGSERAGDLGRAAAAFEEALLMRSGDDDARHALELVRGEVARRRARTGKNVVVATPSLDRAVVALASPRAWMFAAIAGSWLLAVGLGLRRRREGPAHLAGTLLVPLSCAALAFLVPAALWADHLDRTTRPAVLVAKEAYLVDDQSRALGGDPITEAARLELGARRGDMVKVRYGTREGWIPGETVRVLRIR